MSHTPSRYAETNFATFSVHASGASQTIFTTNTYEVKDWTTAEWNVGSQFNLTTNVFEATVAGYYMFSGSITLDTSSTAMVGILKNGTPEVESGSTTGTTFYVESPPIYLNGTTDTVSLAINRSAGTGLNYDESTDLTWFTGAFIHGE